MAYQAFYNKYRPQTFDEVVGQKAIVETLKNAIKEDKIAHAYLFCGPRGTGKTSMARLFAKALNCQEGFGLQCNKCDSCQSIIKGEHPDVFEIDAASNSTVDSVRQLIDNVPYQPIMSKYKIYIIDEVHNMSNSAFNALLKTLEEPPEFVIFILATTEPQKILPTILSRVQRFDFGKVSDKDLVKNMKRVLDSEHIKYDEEALRLIASLSDGGVRDSLSLLDKLVSYAGDNLSITDVDEMLGLLSLSDELDIVNMIENQESQKVISLIKEKYDQGMDILKLHDDLIHIYKDFIIYKITKDANLMDKLKVEEVKLLNLDLDSARNKISTLLTSKREYRNTDDIFSHFELTILNLMSELITPVKKENKPTIETKQAEISSQAVEIKSTNISKGIDIEVKKDEAIDDTIKYDVKEILNLMLQADKNLRLQINEKWKDLIEISYDADKGYEAKALYGCKPRLVTKNIILVSSQFQSELNKINTKKIQPKLMQISEEVFSNSYHILPILDADYMDAVQRFKSGERVETHTPTIDFGTDSTISASTQFMNELLG